MTKITLTSLETQEGPFAADELTLFIVRDQMPIYTMGNPLIKPSSQTILHGEVDFDKKNKEGFDSVMEDNDFAAFDITIEEDGKIVTLKNCLFITWSEDDCNFVADSVESKLSIMEILDLGEDGPVDSCRIFKASKTSGDKTRTTFDGFQTNDSNWSGGLGLL